MFGRDSDLVIHGDQLSAHARLAPGSLSLQENSISVHLVESSFTKNRYDQPLTREQFMMLLRNVRAVYLRAKLDDQWYETRLMRLELDQADPDSMKTNATSDQPVKMARLVERCSCPVGYTGNSCEVSVLTAFILKKF